ncbi:ThiF family adenylyltransferase [Saccharothrix sp. BKS2]|uniref:HesA/MoeB/ThiF family protein n=1 Tax=Saccharothrix sp. BKS2 TaxID=3064400 RepID=UPI0039EC3449
MFRPRIKFEHRPVRYGEDRIRIGGDIMGIAAEIGDPEGWVWALLNILDGTRTVDQVLADLVHRFPRLSHAEAREAVDDLIRAGYVYDTAAPPPERVIEAKWGRYDRGAMLLRWMDRTPDRGAWDAQLLLHQSRVTVVGLGGVGAAAAWALAASGVGQVHCVDGDVVELSNLNRQLLYTEQDLGRSKVEVAVEQLRKHNSQVSITGQHGVIDRPDTLWSLAAGCDVLLLAADTPGDIRSWTNRACLATGTVWVHSGYHGPQVHVGLYRPGSGPCSDCGRAARLERDATLPPLTGWAPARGQQGPHAANAVTAGITGQLAAHAVISLITGAPALPVNREYGVNLVTLRGHTVGLDSPRADCPACHGLV